MARFKRKVVMRWRGKSDAASSSRDPLARETIRPERRMVMRQVAFQLENTGRWNGASNGAQEPHKHLQPPFAETILATRRLPHRAAYCGRKIACQQIRLDFARAAEILDDEAARLLDRAVLRLIAAPPANPVAFFRKFGDRRIATVPAPQYSDVQSSSRPFFQLIFRHHIHASAKPIKAAAYISSHLPDCSKA